MTVPEILEWLSGEIDDVNAIRETVTDPAKRDILAGVAVYIQDMSDRLGATAMRAMDGDTTAGRRQDPNTKGKP